MNTTTASANRLEQEYDLRCSVCCRLAEALGDSLRESRRHPLLSSEYSDALRQICAVLLQIEKHRANHADYASGVA